MTISLIVKVRLKEGYVLKMQDSESQDEMATNKKQLRVISTS